MPRAQSFKLPLVNFDRGRRPKDFLLPAIPRPFAQRGVTLGRRSPGTPVPGVPNERTLARTRPAHESCHPSRSRTPPRGTVEPCLGAQVPATVGLRCRPWLCYMALDQPPSRAFGLCATACSFFGNQDSSDDAGRDPRNAARVGRITPNDWWFWPWWLCTSSSESPLLDG